MVFLFEGFMLRVLGIRDRSEIFPGGRLGEKGKRFLRNLKTVV